MGVPSHSRPAGFTLVELLLASAFGVILLGGLMMMATFLLRAGLREDNQQSAQDAWARVNQFLNIEVGEAGRIYLRTTAVGPIVLGQAPTCSGASQDGGSESFSITVPNPDPASTVPFRTISYYMSGGHLMRCGPPVLANGALNFSAPSSEAILSYDTTLRQLSRTYENRSIAYTLEFRSAHSTEPEFTGVGRAWAQSSIIELQD
jgi:type II secretory pathway pseudopilin PulG